jgi:hypothetical protein
MTASLHTRRVLAPYMLSLLPSLFTLRACRSRHSARRIGISMHFCKQVDLNLHQIEAALFAFGNPFSRGAILADEVGLGKTIEAGLPLAQKWAKRKQRLLVIAPANLRSQVNSSQKPDLGFKVFKLSESNFKT